MRYEIWNKASSLNGVPAKQIMEELHFKNDDEIFLIYDEYDRLTNIENAKNIQAIYKMRKSMTVDEIAQEYIRIRHEDEKRNYEQQRQEESAQNKISILEGENKSLREGLQAVLSGDMQSLAYILYPKDFTNINESNTTLEL